VIDLAGIPPGTDPATVATETVMRFGWLQGPSVLILSAVSIVAIGFFRITRARHAEILLEIEARRR
jgi:Na+/melibiose symporter-like transporter